MNTVQHMCCLQAQNCLSLSICSCSPVYTLVSAMSKYLGSQAVLYVCNVSTYTSRVVHLAVCSGALEDSCSRGFRSPSTSNAPQHEGSSLQSSVMVPSLS